MLENRQYSFFWVFGVLTFGASISDMALAGEINYKIMLFIFLALGAFIHGLYKRYKWYKQKDSTTF